MDDARHDAQATLHRFEENVRRLIDLDAGGHEDDPDRPMSEFNSVMNDATRGPIESDAQLRIILGGLDYLLNAEADPSRGSLGDLIDDALAEAIAEVSSTRQWALLALARHKLRGGQIELPTTPSISASTRTLRQEFERGLATLRREAKDNLSEEEHQEGFELFFGAMGDIMRGGIRNELELMTVYEGIKFSMKQNSISESLQDAIDYALIAAFENTSTWEHAWLIGLARFQMQGFNAKPWNYPEPGFQRWIGVEERATASA